MDQAKHRAAHPWKMAILKLGAAAAALAICLLAGCGRASIAEPNVTFKDLQGRDVRLATFRGKVVLLNFWGTWCDPCRGEIPELIKLQQQYGPKGFTVLGAAMEEEPSQVTPFMKNQQFDVDGRKMLMNYPVVMGSDEIASKFGGLIGYPTSFLISPDGKVQKRYVGPITEDEIRSDIQSAFKASS